MIWVQVNVPQVVSPAPKSDCHQSAASVEETDGVNTVTWDVFSAFEWLKTFSVDEKVDIINNVDKIKTRDTEEDPHVKSLSLTFTQNPDFDIRILIFLLGILTLIKDNLKFPHVTQILLCSIKTRWLHRLPWLLRFLVFMLLVSV